MSESSKQLNIIPKQLISVYQKKWKNIALAKNLLDRNCCDRTINLIYHSIGLPTPQILFFDSPYAALKTLAIQPNERMGRRIRSQIETQAIALLQSSLEQQLNEELISQIKSQWEFENIEQLENLAWVELQERLKTEIDEKQWQILNNQLWTVNNSKINNSTEPKIECILNGFYGNMWTSLACLADYCINTLNCQCDINLWEILKNLVTTCGWIFPFEKVCFVCDRPRKIILNHEEQLHNLQDTAIEYADGYGVYAYHGIILPEKYGRVHPAQWQSQWLSSEKNSQLQQILIQTIGYNRLYQELETIELDSYQGHTLVKIALDSLSEPIHLLKMHFGDNEINCLSVPSNICSAKEALGWLNWDVSSDAKLIR